MFFNSGDTAPFSMKGEKVIIAILVLASISGAFSSAAAAQNAIMPGKFSVEPPTLMSLGFDWMISGDDNRNARVKVSYRQKGDPRWHDALPLMRLQNEWVGTPIDPGYPKTPVLDGIEYVNPFHYLVPNMFSGSILNLHPDTEYECRFVLSDPDGVKGLTRRIVTARTRREPQPAEGGRVFHVYPYGYKGKKQEPSFTGLLAAYYMGSNHSDHANSYPTRVQKGDTILVHAGLYKDNRFHYSGFYPNEAAYGTPFDGTYYLTVSGTPDQPIVIKGAGDGEAIFDGDGCQTLFNLLAANYNYFEGITIRNTNVAFLAGLKNIIGSSGFTLKRCRLENIGRGVQADWSGSKNFYIADNVFLGRHDPLKLLGWFWPETWGKFENYPAALTSEYAVKVYGQGHVVAYNYAANWHDGIDVATYGNPDGTAADGTPHEIAERVPVSIDIYNNDITNTADNCIESDGGARNIRVFRNRCFNSTGGGLSSQPIFGGPNYIFQNVVYNTTTGGAIKYIDNPSGILVYQNTFIGSANVTTPSSNLHYRNNLILADGWSDPALTVTTFTNYTSSDYNGFRPAPLGKAAFGWISPPFEIKADYSKKQIVREYKTLDDCSRATGQDKHSILVDYDVFVNVKMPDKSNPQRLYSPEEFDFSLKPGSAAVDAGMILPTINDDYTGKMPDLGAYEIGRPLPHYGPR
jgi:hypothetical protein